MIYLYALLDSMWAPPTKDLTGVTGVVEATRMGRGWLIHGPAEDDDILPKRRQLLAHARVQEALMPEGTVLPMRFGIFADDLPQITRLVDQRADEIAERFDALAGRAEIGLRIAFPRHAALEATLAADSRLRLEHDRLSRCARPPHFEVAEFGRRLAEALDQRRGAAQRRLIAALRGQWEDYVLKAPETDVEVLSVECLIAASSIDAVALQAQEHAAALTEFAGGAEPSIQISVRFRPFISSNWPSTRVTRWTPDMGLLSTILLAPLTMPMRSTLWISRKLAETAASERDDPAALRALLKEAERQLLSGLMTEEE